MILLWWLGCGPAVDVATDSCEGSPWLAPASLEVDVGGAVALAGQATVCTVTSSRPALVCWLSTDTTCEDYLDPPRTADGLAVCAADSTTHTGDPSGARCQLGTSAGLLELEAR